jgi:hypothetical protein
MFVTSGRSCMIASPCLKSLCRMSLDKRPFKLSRGLQPSSQVTGNARLSKSRTTPSLLVASAEGRCILSAAGLAVTNGNCRCFRINREQDFTPVSILSEAHYTWVLSLVSPFQTIAGSRSQVSWASTSQPYHHK